MNLQPQINKALKEGDEVRLRTLRMLASELHNLEIDKKELSEDDEMEILKREIKKRKDAIEAYKSAGREDKSNDEEAELKILEEFLPSQMDDDELEAIVKEEINKTGATEIKDMGRVIGSVMAKVGATADGARVAEIVKNNLQK